MEGTLFKEEILVVNFSTDVMHSYVLKNDKYGNLIMSSRKGKTKMYISDQCTRTGDKIKIKWKKTDSDSSLSLRSEKHVYRAHSEREAKVWCDTINEHLKSHRSKHKHYKAHCI